MHRKLATQSRMIALRGCERSSQREVRFVREMCDLEILYYRVSYLSFFDIKKRAWWIEK